MANRFIDGLRPALRKARTRLNSKLLRIIAFNLPVVLRAITRFRKPSNKILIIKTDAIGDYILFRNFFEQVRQSNRYKGYEIDLLGNPSWKELALAYDGAYLNHYQWIRNDDYHLAPFKTLKLGWHFFKRNYAVVLQPSSTRIFITDAVAALSAAKQVIGFESNTEGIIKKHKVRLDKFYTEKLILPLNYYFEFDRNLFFFEKVLQQKISLQKPSLPVRNNIHKRGILIFPGAGVHRRRWEQEKFISLINLILSNSSEDIYLAGSLTEVDIANHLADDLKSGRVINLTGKLSLVELIDKINTAELVVSNETSAVHIAAAVNTRAVCILGGGHFDRFAPYPKFDGIDIFYAFKKMECYHCNWICKYPLTESAAYPCISNISINDVWEVVKPALAELENINGK